MRLHKYFRTAWLGAWLLKDLEQQCNQGNVIGTTRWPPRPEAESRGGRRGYATRGAAAQA